MGAYAWALIGLVLTGGSFWSLLGGIAGFLLCCARARSLHVSRDGRFLIIANFYSVKRLEIIPGMTIRPFYHWAQVNFDCMAVYMPGVILKQIHACVMPGREPARREAAQQAAHALGLPLLDTTVGTFKQIMRLW